MMATIKWIEEKLETGSAGGKAYNLSRLAAGGFNVPPGFVLAAADLQGAAAGELSPELSVELKAAFKELPAPLAAVRSSAAAEDGAAASFAGQFDSFLGVNAAGLEKAVLACAASARGARAAAYGGGPAPRMSVIVQTLVEAEISGVAFSCDPVLGGRDTVLVEAVYGLCEPLVCGRMTPDHYVLTRPGLKPKEISVALQEEYLAVNQAGGTVLRPVAPELRNRPKLDAESMRLVAAAAVRAEELIGKPADIEWAMRAGDLFLLQARPVTGLGD